jgi:nanoRNase/pAp phosphatase (c-di-AMP/oligoRNAs hydrolase)
MQQGISFRAQKDNVDVTEVAKIYGGGGHVKASGAPMDNSLKKEVLKLILNNNNLFN